MSKYKYLITKNSIIAVGTTLLIITALIFHLTKFADHHIPLMIALILGGGPLVFDLLKNVAKFHFSADLLAGIAIVVAIFADEHLAGAIIVLMLSGGQSLEDFAVRKASFALEALAKRMPTIAHKKIEEKIVDVPISEVEIGDQLVIFPHEVCPADGSVVEGYSTMDEAYLTGEPYSISKAPGAQAFSGTVNGTGAITIRADKKPADSRFAQIVKIMNSAREEKPNIRRLADRLGALYTPLALLVATGAWYFSNDPKRFLAVLVVATPCPLLIAIPVAIIGAVSLAARSGIIIRSVSILEELKYCKTFIFDKTGTLTHGEPTLETIICVGGFSETILLQLAASLEQYSKHPLSGAVLDEAKRRGIGFSAVSEVHEIPGQGLNGLVSGKLVQVTGRNKLAQFTNINATLLPPPTSGLECLILVDNQLAGIFRFKDQVRRGSKSFIEHLSEKHHTNKIMLVSGDRRNEVEDFALRMGIKDYFAEQSPEDKLRIVKDEQLRAKVMFVGDGINDAPAIVQANAGVSIGQHTEIAREAAGAVIVDASLESVDKLLHIAEHFNKIARQSAIGGIGASVLGMIFAAFGLISPLQGALLQEAIDVISLLNALRCAYPPKSLVDFE